MIPRWHLVDHPESSPALRPTLGAAETAPGPQGLPHFKHEARLDCNHDVMMSENNTHLVAHPVGLSQHLSRSRARQVMRQ
jgi:hypothetical protein